MAYVKILQTFFGIFGYGSNHQASGFKQNVALQHWHWGYDVHHGFQLYHTDPSGNFSGWKVDEDVGLGHGDHMVLNSS